MLNTKELPTRSRTLPVLEMLLSLFCASCGSDISNYPEDKSSNRDHGVPDSLSEEVVDFPGTLLAGSDAAPSVVMRVSTFHPDLSRCGDRCSEAALDEANASQREVESDRTELLAFLGSYEQDTSTDESINVVLYLSSIPTFDASVLRLSPDDVRSEIISDRQEFVRITVEEHADRLSQMGFTLHGHSWSTGAVFASGSRDHIVEHLRDPVFSSIVLGDNGQWTSQPTSYSGFETRDGTNALALDNLGHDANNVTHQAGGPVRIGIIDIGIPNTNHPVFIDNPGGATRWKGVRSCTSPSGCVLLSTSQPGSGDTHAHYVSALASSSIVQGQDSQYAAGSYGAARRSFGAREASLYVYDYNSAQTLLVAIVTAVDQALVDNVDILNMSFNSDCSYPNINSSCSGARGALQTAYAAGILLVSGSGNGGQYNQDILFPAVRSEVLSVGAVDASNGFASYHDLVVDPISSIGPVNVVNAYGASATVPGVDLVAPHRMADYAERASGYRAIDCSGTSCAAPTVSGMAAQIIDGLDALGWTAILANSGRLSNYMRLMGDASDGVSLNGESNSSVSHVAGYGRLFSHVPSSSDLTSPWGVGTHAPIIYQGQLLRYSVWDAGPESNSVTEWKWAVSWDEPNLTNMRSDITISVENTCAPSGTTLVASDNSFSNTKRIHLNAGSIGGRCLEMVVHAHRTPPQGQQIYLSDYFHGGSTNLH